MAISPKKLVEAQLALMSKETGMLDDLCKRQLEQRYQINHSVEVNVAGFSRLAISVIIKRYEDLEWSVKYFRRGNCDLLEFAAQDTERYY